MKKGGSRKTLGGEKEEGKNTSREVFPKGTQKKKKKPD